MTRWSLSSKQLHVLVIISYNQNEMSMVHGAIDKGVSRVLADTYLQERPGWVARYIFSTTLVEPRAQQINI